MKFEHQIDDQGRSTMVEQREVTNVITLDDYRDTPLPARGVVTPHEIAPERRQPVLKPSESGGSGLGYRPRRWWHDQAKRQEFDRVARRAFVVVLAICGAALALGAW